MTAVLVTAPGRWEFTEPVEPTPGAAEVRIRIAGCGLCGTDLHTLGGDNPTVRLPITPGHEFVGTVVETGSGVTALTVGTRVAVDPSRSCGHCRFCLGGHANVCADKGGYGARYPGGFAGHAAVPATSCVPLPDGMSWRSAVLAEPTACVLNGVDKLGAVAGHRALVLGGGTIGVLCAAVLTRRGAEVTVVEPAADRRALAALVGGATVFDPSALPDEPFDVVVDATGVPAVIQQAVGLLDRAGVLLVMGVAPSAATTSFSPARLNWQEQSILGSTSVNGRLPAAVEFLHDSGDRLLPVVSEVFDLDEFEEALAALRSGRGTKTVVRCDPEETW